LEAKETLYYIKYIKSNISACLDAQQAGQIPILELTIWARQDGRTEATINPQKDPQIRDGWFLSDLTKRLMRAVDEWDRDDIGQKDGHVVDMMSKLGWVKGFGTAD